MSLSNHMILVVDDEPATLRATSRVLRSAGYEVAEAAAGNDALRLAHEHQPDLILLDVVLPDIDGLTVCRAIRDDPASRSTMIIMLSGKSIESTQQVQGLESGADDYLVRPVPVPELLARVRAMLRIRRTEVELRERASQQSAVAALGQRALSGAALDVLLNEAAALVAKTLRVESCDVMEWAPEQNSFIQRASFKQGLTLAGGSVLPFHNSQAGYTLQVNAPVVAEDLRSESRFQVPQQMLDLGMVSGLSVVIQGRERPYGVLGAHTLRQQRFSQDDVNFLQSVANVLAAAIQRENDQAALAEMAAIVQSSNDAIIATDLKDVITSWNPGAERLYGFPASEALGRTIGLIIPDDRHDEQGSMRIEPRRGGAMSQIETVRQRKDGALVDVSVSISPIKDAAGQITGIASIGRDITERKHAEATFKRYGLLFEHARDVMAFVRLSDGQFLDINRAAEAMYGYTRDELLSKTIFDLRAPESQPRLRVESMQPDNRNVYFESLHQRKDGSRFPVEISSTGTTIGGVRMWLSIIRDITERQRAGQAMKGLLDETRQRARELGSLVQVATALREASRRAEMLPMILDQLMALLQADGALVTADSRGDRGYLVELGRGVWASTTQKIIPPGVLDIDALFAAGQPFVLAAVPLSANIAGLGMPVDPHAMACVPLADQERIIGAIAVRRPMPFTPEEIRLLAAVGDMAASAIDLATSYERIERDLKQAQALHEIDMAITASIEVRVSLDLALRHIATQLGADAACVLALKAHACMCEMVVAHHFQSRQASQAHPAITLGPISQAILERRIVHVPDLAGEPAFERAHLLKGGEYAACSIVPLVAQGQVKGVLEVFYRQPPMADSQQSNFLESVGTLAAIALDKAETFGDLQRSNIQLRLAYEATLEGWARALEMRDAQTHGHTTRTVVLTEQIARALKLPDEDLMYIRWGALLHDIGKLAIPDAILLKPGALTNEEWKVMQQHPQYAYEMLSPITYLRSAVDIPFGHHERWDGRGYPRGLRGYDIPIAARIFAVVDAWDALTTDRPYRPAWMPAKAREYIVEQRGKSFDPQVVDAFCNLIDGM